MRLKQKRIRTVSSDSQGCCLRTATEYPRVWYRTIFLMYKSTCKREYLYKGGERPRLRIAIFITPVLRGFLANEMTKFILPKNLFIVKGDGYFKLSRHEFLSNISKNNEFKMQT